MRSGYRQAPGKKRIVTQRHYYSPTYKETKVEDRVPLAITIEQKRDSLEFKLIVATVALGLMSAAISGYAAYFTSSQAEAAFKSLTAGSSNLAAENYIAALGRVCNNYDESGGRFYASFQYKDGSPAKVVVTAQKVGFIGISYNNKAEYEADQRDANRKQVADRSLAKLNLSDSLEVMRIWFPSDKINQLENYTTLAQSLDGYVLKRGEHIEHGIKRMGYCRHIQREAIKLIAGEPSKIDAAFEATEIENSGDSSFMFE